MDTLAQLIVNGVAVGSIIALAAVGLTLTYGILRISNFAHGDFLTLGAYLTFFFNFLGLNIWLCMILAAVGTVGIMLLAEKLLWSRMRSIRATSTTLIIISIGLALFLRNGIIFIWGPLSLRPRLPLLLGPLLAASALAQQHNFYLAWQKPKLPTIGKYCPRPLGRESATTPTFSIRISDRRHYSPSLSPPKYQNR